MIKMVPLIDNQNKMRCRTASDGGNVCSSGGVTAKHGPAHARLMLGRASLLQLCIVNNISRGCRPETRHTDTSPANTGHIHKDAGGGCGASSKHAPQKLYKFYHQGVELVASE